MSAAAESADALEAEIEERGYAKFRLLAEPAAAELLSDILALRPGAAFDRAEGSKGFEFHSSFLDKDLDYRRRVHEAVLAACRPGFESRFPGFRIIIGAFLMKPPGAGDVEVHHDWSMMRDRGRRAIHVWSPLVEAGPEIGVLHLIDGSHGIVDHIGAPHTPVYCRGYQDRIKAGSSAGTLRPGEALAYDATILHWSPPNRSAGPRPAVTLTCLPEDVEPVFYRRDADGDRFEMYDMSGGGFFEHSAEDFFAGRIRRPSLGFVDSPNRELSAADYERLLAAARRRRGGAERPSLWARLRGALGA